MGAALALHQPGGRQGDERHAADRPINCWSTPEAWARNVEKQLSKSGASPNRAGITEARRATQIKPFRAKWCVSTIPQSDPNPKWAQDVSID